MYSVLRDYSFSAAHRLQDHPKCGRLHGHNYHVKVEVSHDKLNDEGMVIEFSDMDYHIDSIMASMDHRYLMSMGEILAWPKTGDVFHLPTIASSAECIAAYICEELRKDLYWPLVIKVFVAENQRSTATYVSSK